MGVGGCRAEFAYGYRNDGGYPTPLPQPVRDFAGTMNCGSWQYKYQQCNVRTNDRVELTHKIAGKCNAGRQWGYTSDYIWVDKGCRAEFGYGYRNVRPPEKDKDKGPSTGLIIGGIVVAGGLLASARERQEESRDRSIRKRQRRRNHLSRRSSGDAQRQSLGAAERVAAIGAELHDRRGAPDRRDRGNPVVL